MSEYIKREDALNQTITVRHFDGKLGGVCDHKYVRVEDINAIPAADVEPVVRARWKGEGMGDYRCSWCGDVVSGKPNYCRNCGANMMERSGSGE